MVLHVELDDVVVLGVLLAEHPVVLLVVVVLPGKEQVNHLLPVHLMHVAPRVSGCHALHELARTDRTAHDDVGVVRADRRVVNHRVIGVGVAHRHVLDAVLLVGINAVLRRVFEAVLLLPFQNAVVHGFRLSKQVLLHDVRPFVDRKGRKHVAIHEFLHSYALSPAHSKSHWKSCTRWRPAWTRWRHSPLHRWRLSSTHRD